MRTLLGTLAISAAVATLPATALSVTALSSAASAHMPRHHHRLRVHRPLAGHGSGGYAGGRFGPSANFSQEPFDSGRFDPYAGYIGPGSTVLNATERARREPGVTTELAPDAKETATGGPVGGVPGFDGN